MKGCGHLLKIRSALVIDYIDAVKIRAFSFGRFSNRRFIAEQGNARNVSTRAYCSRDHGAGIVAFRQNDMLRITSSSLPKCLEYVHRIGWSGLQQRV
jgi:hypothetical protein